MTSPPDGVPFLAALRSPEPVVTVELRPPSMGLRGGAAVDVWIDTFHAVRRLTRTGHFVFVTDNAVGAAEEENLFHLEGNLADEGDPAHVVPFLTCKHSLDYCVTYAKRAWAHGFRALTVLGGDRSVGPPRCLPHAYLLRAQIREKVPGLALGGWANPHADPGEQARYLADSRATTDFFLSQVVSHHSAARVRALRAALDTHAPDLPGSFGVFFYRSARPETLSRLSHFFPVPAEELTREFEEEGADPEEVCARSLRALRDAGVRNIYVSNLPIRNTARTLESILERV